jgi:hypothetical protein
LGGFVIRSELGQQELERDALPQLEVHGRNDHAHPALPENAFDLVLAREDLPRAHGRLRNLHSHVATIPVLYRSVNDRHGPGARGT